MDKDFVGTIIEESLEDKNVLEDVKILSTKVEKVTEKDKTPWIKQWTLHTVEVHIDQADAVAKKLSMSLDSKHDWYADFKNNAFHFIIFRDKVFKIDKRNKEQYDEARKYGISLGIPEYQLDFQSDILKLKRLIYEVKKLWNADKKKT